MADQDIDRSEQATPFKLQKAREKGQVARSSDAVSCCVFIAAMACIAWHGPHAVRSMLEMASVAFGQAGKVEATAGTLWPLAAQAAMHAAGSIIPFLIALPLAAVLSSVAQTGGVFSLEPLQADFARVNPATGLERLFSLRTLFDGARACVKVVVLTVAAAIALQAVVPHFHAIAGLPPAAFLQTLLQDVTSLGFKMAAALAVVAAVDIVYTRREFDGRMRMSRRELKDEFRNREGDPRIRGRLRQLRAEMLQRSRALANTRTADVVLTNPTHYAVALRYVHGEMDAPRLVAKGAGQLAAAMREIAGRHEIVVVQNPPLARRLFREAAIDAYLPQSFHAEVARVIVWVLAMRQQSAAAAGASR